MSTHSIQAPAAVVMVRPHQFYPNPQTAHDNTFQHDAASSAVAPSEELAQRVYQEVSQVAGRLESAGVQVHLFEDKGEQQTPDSVFPNNWFSTHPGGHVAIYPMYAANRRRERRQDIIDMLKACYRVQDVIDYSGLEHDGLFLEGTGAMVLDHLGRVAYASLSQRTSEVLLERFCTHFNFEPMAFPTQGADNDQPVYHTNVMLCIATGFALLGQDLISDPHRRQAVAQRLCNHGRELIALSTQQIQAFAGNALELATSQGPVLAMSSAGVNSLNAQQRKAIERHANILALSVPTIELAGGSVRCMLAGVHLTPRR
jgi:hypothetical protein